MTRPFPDRPNHWVGICIRAGCTHVHPSPLTSTDVDTHLAGAHPGDGADPARSFKFVWNGPEEIAS